MGKAKKKSTPRKTIWTDEEKLFSAKSKLINLDLSKLFSAPEAWSMLDEAEKVQLRALLPPHIELNDDGSIPQSFLKYDPDWRNALHQFQTDLGAGRYDPSWLEEAAQAMEERASGVFDSFKETEFEEFWGQKQRVKQQLSGETATVKLGDLINSALFQIGDVWSYKRTIGRSANERIQVEKDCVITAIEEGALTFLIPPGRSKFLTAEHCLENIASRHSHRETVQTAEHLESLEHDFLESKDPEIASDSAAQFSTKRKQGEIYASSPISRPKETDVLEAPSVLTKRSKKSHELVSPPLSTLPWAGGMPLVESFTVVAALANSNDGELTRETQESGGSDMHSHARSSPLSTALSSPSIPVESQPPSTPSEHLSCNALSNENVLQQPSFASTVTITAPRALETRVIYVDGRIQNPPAVNSWRNFRVKRREQDIGSLWEIREEFWVRRQAE